MLADATVRLRAARIESPRVDAELLLAARLGIARTALLTRDRLPASVLTAYQDDLDRRVAREPLQHITGTAPFRHIELAVGRGVFVPRPETELLVDAVLPLLRVIDEPNVVDLCSGSGALALAIADEVPAARVVAVEAALDASRYLARNAAGTRVRVVTGDIRDPELLRALAGQADAVVCNPPYVPTPTDVSAEVLADPREAVFAGVDGLDLIPAVLARAAQLLRPGGLLAVEHDESHQDAVRALAADSGNWRHIDAHDDLAGRPRFVTAERR